MEVVPWAELVALIEPYAPDSGQARSAALCGADLLRIHFMQQWFNLSDPAMQEALHDVPAFRDFAGLSHWDEHIPSESSILRFLHLLQCHNKDKPLDELVEQLERTKERIRAKVEHPLRVLKQQFGYVKVRYRGLKKNTAQITLMGVIPLFK